VVSEDTTAFVERLEVRLEDKRAERLRHRIRAAQLAVLESQSHLRAITELVRALESAASDDASVRRDLARARSRVTKAQHDFERRRARVEKHERELRALEEHVESVVSFRFHSEEHHIDCSEERFLELRRAQRTSPRKLLTGRGRQWWWYSDRFWWDESRLSTREFASAVREVDLMAALRRQVADAARTGSSELTHGVDGERAIPEHVRTAVWRRDDGRCVDCGSEDELAFASTAAPEAADATLTANDFQLVCRLCSSLRKQPGSGALAWDAPGR
jgi:hypothetical protein